MLQDIVTTDYRAVRFMLPFGDFASSPIPQSVDAYIVYCNAGIRFLKAPARRIRD